MRFSFAVETAAWIFLGMAAAAFAYVVVDLIATRSQKMRIMYIVWPVTALWAGPFGAWAYAQWGKGDARDQSFGAVSAKATSHCGAGCTVGDVVAECFSIAVPFTLLGHRLFGAWVYDLVAAYVIGIVFQYFTIKPMKNLSPKEGLIEALKADTLSLLAWQIGMYATMAFFRFALAGRELPPTSPVFWWSMQAAMFGGFLVSWPVNAWLVKRGIKVRM